MAKNSSATINWIVGGIAAYFVGSAIAGAIRRSKGIGKVERIKRRIYKEVSLAQDAGVDFSRKYDELTPDMKDALNMLGHDLGWKQSKRAIESGKPYTESYYGSLRRAWNAVSGVQGIGRAYNVKDANGNTVLTWIEDAAAHVEAEAVPVAPVAPKENLIRKGMNILADGITMGEKKKVTKPKAPTKAEQKENEYAERSLFAEEFLSDYVEEKVKTGHRHVQEYLNQTDTNGTPIDILIVNSFAKGELKVNDKKGKIDVFINGEWISGAGMLYNICSALLEAWRTRGLRSENLDDIRRQLLDRAKFMAVSDDGSAFGAPIQGDDRYNYLDKINWIVVFYDYYENGEKTVYPYRAFDSEIMANMFADSYKRLKNNNSLGLRRQVKIMPITELDIKSITGIFSK